MKVVVVGATGVIGQAAARRFAERDGCEVVTVSRRRPLVDGARHVAVDLTDAAAARDALDDTTFDGVTHVVYAALRESHDLVSGWHDQELMATNLAMFANTLDPLQRRAGAALQHVSLLQGAKAYGLHVDRVPVPARERSPRHRHENFYFLQEDLLRRRAAEAGWSWTVLRPQVVFGDSFASPMNLVPAIGVYGALRRADGLPLSFPGGPPHVSEAVDADLLADALVWAATAPAAADEVFNVTNGDVYVWHHVWPAIAETLGMEVGEPEPLDLAATMPGRAEEWAALVDRHHLRSPRDLDAFVGGAWQYADLLFGAGGGPPRLPALLSTIKIRHAGFHACVDTEDMFRRWLRRYQELGYFPGP